MHYCWRKNTAYSENNLTEKGVGTGCYLFENLHPGPLAPHVNMRDVYHTYMTQG